MTKRVFRFSETIAGKQRQACPSLGFWPILLVVVTLTVFSGVRPSHAEGVIRVGVYGFPPLVFVGEDGNPGGLFIDVLEHIARKEGWHIEYVPGTWDQSLSRIESGEIDLITCIGYSKERTAKMDFTKQFLFLDWGRVYQKIGARSESVFDLEGKKVAVLKGSIYTLGFKSLLEQFEVKADLVEKNDYRQVFRAVESGEVDVGINGRVAGIFMGSDYEIKPTEILFSPVKIGFATPKGKGAHILGTLDEAIAGLKADKSSLYHQRLKYWTEFYAKRSQVSPWLFRGVVAAGTLCLLSLVFLYLLERRVRIRTSELALSNEALQTSEAKFRMFVERMPVITYTAALDANSTTTYMSPQIESLLGISPADFSADPDLWRKSLHDDDRDRVLADVAQSHSTGDPFVCEYRMTGRDGQIRWFRDEASVVHDDQGRPLLLLGVMVDITERKEMERNLEETLRELKTSHAETNGYLEASRTLLEGRSFESAARNIFDTCKKLTGASAGYIALLNNDGSENELLFLDAGGLPCAVDPDLPMPIRGLRAEAYRTGSPVCDNNFAESKWVEFLPEGHVTPDNVMFAPLVIAGKAVGDLGLANKPGGFNNRDMKVASAFSEYAAIGLKNAMAEEALRQSEAKYREIFENAVLGIFQSTPEGAYREINSAFARMFGYDSPEQMKDEVTDISRQVYVRPEDRETFKHLLTSQGFVKNFEAEGRGRDGTHRWIGINARAIHGSAGEVLYYQGTTEDITERKRVQEQLEESEARVRLKLDSIISPEGDIGTLDLGDVIDVDEIQELMNDFYGLTNIGIGVIDLKGKVLVGTGWQDICTKFHRMHPETCRNCTASDTELSAGLKEGEFKLYRCLNNMWDIATPIMVGGNHLGNLFLGQFLFEGEEPDYEIFRAQARQYGFDEPEYLAALDRVPRWSRETVDTGMRFYARLTRILSRLSFSNINLARSMAERERLLNSLAESEHRYRLLADNTLDVIWQMDLDLRFTYVNPAIFELTGYTPDEWIGTKLQEHCDEENFKKMAQEASEEIERGPYGAGRNFEAVMLKRNGEPISVEVRGRAIFDQNQEPIAVQGVARDITERKHAEKALKISHHRLDQIIEFLPDATFVIDSKGKVEAWNRAMEDLTGVTAEMMIGKGDYEYAVPFYGERRPALLDLALEWDDDYSDKYISVKKHDGDVMVSESYHPNLKGGIYLAGTARVLYDAEGKPVGAIESLRDITEVKLAEKALRQSERRWAQVIEFLPDATMVIDREGTVIGWNYAMEELTGVDARAMLGKGNHEYALPFYGRRRPVMIDLVMDYDQKIASHYQYVRQHGDRFISETYLSDFRGRGPIWLWNVAAPLYDERGEIVGAIEAIRDITDRRQAEEALRESEERYRQITENSLTGIFVYQDGKSVYANKRLAEIVGYNSEEVLSIPFLEMIHPDDRRMVEQMAKARISGEPVPNHYDLRLVDKDGRTVWTEIMAHRIEYQGRPAILGNVADVTESRILEDQLRQAQKMEAVGTLAGGIAHDFNNILHIISGHAELLEMDLAEQDMQFEETAAIRQTAHRGADLVKQILTFSRRVDRKLESMNLNEEVKNTERLLYRTLPKMIEIELRLEKGLKPVRADSTQVEQMLINLAVNAKDAMPDGGKLTVETRNVILDEASCRRHADLSPGPYVLLKVSDTGHGMEEEVKQHIFEPFFTTKGLAEGTGLGLATVFGIVKMHAGHITCESEVGKGTAFSVYLPVAQAAVREEGRNERAVPVAGGAETILVVDDEPMIRDLAQRILEKSGYSILTANSGREAVEIYAKEGSRISLIVLDLIMPEMGGKQCLEELLKIDPHVKALIASGLVLKGDAQTVLNTKAKGIVAKPFDMRELLRSVRNVLDGM